MRFPALTLIAFVLMPAASSGATTIDFEGTSEGTSLRTYYADQDVSLDSACNNPHSYPEAHVLGIGVAHGGSNVAQTICSELYPDFTASFSPGKASVSLWARTGGGSQTYRMYAYDFDGHFISSIGPYSVTSSGWQELLINTGGAETIRSALLQQVCPCTTGTLYVDDLSYAGTPPPPDTTAPTVTIDSPGVTDTTYMDPADPAPTIQATLSDNAGISGWCIAAGNSPATPTQGQCDRSVSGSAPYHVSPLIGDATALEEGDIKLHVWAYDFAGNVTEATRVVHLLNRPNFYVKGVEIAQSVSPTYRDFQNKSPLSDRTLGWNANDFVPLVSGKPTLLRIYIGKSQTSHDYAPLAAMVTATRYSDGQTLPNSPTAASGGSTSEKYPFTDPFLVQEDPNTTINVALPSNWTKGTVDLNVTLNPARNPTECTDCFPQGNSFTLGHVSFKPTGRIVIRPLKILWTGHPKSGGQNYFIVSDSDRLPVWNDVTKLYPITRDHFIVDNWRGGVSVDDTSSCGSILLQVALTADLDAEGGHYVGYMPLESQRDDKFSNAINCGGIAYPYGTTNMSVPVGYVEAQELAHNFGLKHLSCDHNEPQPCENVSIDPNSPYWHARLGGIGYDIAPGPGGSLLGTRGAYREGPDKHMHDYMSYGGDPDYWTSVLTWDRMFNILAQEPGAVESRAGKTLAAAGDVTPRVGNAILVGGFLSKSGARIADVIRARAAISGKVPGASSSDAQIAILNRSGKTLERYTLPDERATHLAPGEPDPFVAALPSKAGAASIVVKRRGKVAARVKRSRHTPVARFKGLGKKLRRGRALTLRWTARDRDGGRLRSSLFYRSGKGDWKALAVGKSGKSLQLAPNTLPSAAKLQFRLLVSDGFNTRAIVSRRLRSF